MIEITLKEIQQIINITSRLIELCLEKLNNSTTTTNNKYLF